MHIQRVYIQLDTYWNDLLLLDASGRRSMHYLLTEIKSIKRQFSRSYNSLACTMIYANGLIIKP